MKKKSLLSIGFLTLFFVVLMFLLNGDKKTDFVPASIEGLEQKLIAGVNKTITSVVQIVAEDNIMFYQETENNKSKSLIKEDLNLLEKGSGIIVSKKGYIITNKHVVNNEDLNYKVVLNDGKTISVKKIRRDDLIDIAILFIETESDLKPAKFISIYEDIYIGQFVTVIGNALSQYNTVSFGIISGKGRKIDPNNGNNYYAGLYQTDAAINPGNSGGPMLNLSGNVIGIITAMSIGGNNIGFAIPTSQEFIETTINKIGKFDNINSPYLGIKHTNLKNGARIDMIRDNSPMKGFLLSGDIITAIDKHKISLNLPLLYHIYIYKPGDMIVFTVDRGNKTLSIPIVL